MPGDGQGPGPAGFTPGVWSRRPLKRSLRRSRGLGRGARSEGKLNHPRSRSAPARPLRVLTFAEAERRALEPALGEPIVELPRLPVLLGVADFFAFPVVGPRPPTVERPPPPDLPRPAA